MKCLILGGKGFLGGNICASLLYNGHEVVVFDRQSAEIEVSDPRIAYIDGDFLNSGNLETALEGCDVVFHLISSTLPKNSNADMFFDIDSNLRGTVKLLTLAVKKQIKKIIFPSSGGTVYGVPQNIPIRETDATNPICSYGVCKLAIEKYLHLFHALYGLDFTVLRIANAYGEGQRTEATQGAVGVFIGKALRHRPIEIWGDGSVIRDYVYVKDVANAFCAALTYEGNDKVLNIGSGEGHSLNDILDIIGRKLGTEIKRKYLPPRNIDVPSNVLDCTLAMDNLAWAPKTSFVEGISKTIQYYQSGFKINS